MKNLIERIDQLIELANTTIGTYKHDNDSSFPSIPAVSNELFSQLRTSSLSFIINLYGVTHPYYFDFKDSVIIPETTYVRKALGILKSIKSELEGGWLFTVKGLISAEIFSDFLEMAEYLLSENFKDASAVMIGSVLEEHLRHLCVKNNIPIEDQKSKKVLPKKAELLNAELCNKMVYNKLDQKSITSWLDLRNKAAHGKYSEYNQDQVELMLQGVTEFIKRTTV